MMPTTYEAIHTPCIDGEIAMQQQAMKQVRTRFDYHAASVLALAGGLALALTGIAGPDVAAAQSGVAPSTRLQAPIGHRQPRALDLPSNVRRDEGGATAEQRAVDKKLQICRNC
jgi:hypothetical protein